MVDLSVANCECHNQMVSLILYQLRKSLFLLADFNPHVFLVQLPIKLLKPRGWTNSTVSFETFELYIGTFVKCWWESITKMWTNSTVSLANSRTFLIKASTISEFSENKKSRSALWSPPIFNGTNKRRGLKHLRQKKTEVWLNGSKFRNWCGGYHQTCWKFMEILYFSIDKKGESKQQKTGNFLTIWPSSGSRGSLMKVGIQRDEKP